ncbi:MAG: segregation/condensation protein A [Armatimonadota bacterium]|jgi:segregation and condensation protein A
MISPEIAAQGFDSALAAPKDRTFTGHPVKVSTFEGPLDLLVYLIERDQIDIFDIPIEYITGEYLEYMDSIEQLNIEVAGEFVVMASQLMEIKSRMLLPQEQRPEPDEEEAIGDPRAALVARLIEYRRYKMVAEELRARAELQRLIFSHSVLPEGNGNGNGHERPYLMLNDVSPFDLWAAFQNVLNRIKEPSSAELPRPRFTVAQKIAAIASRIRWARDGLLFADLFEGDVTRLELIVSFLALLELIRLRRVRVAQESPFGEIRVFPGGSSEAE